ADIVQASVQLAARDATSQRDAVQEEPASFGWPADELSAFEHSKEDRAAGWTPLSDASPNLQEVDVRSFSWPESSAAFGQQPLGQATAWPQDDMVLAFGQPEVSEAATPNTGWTPDAFGWPVAATPTQTTADVWGFPAWPGEAHVDAAASEARPQASQGSQPLQESPKAERKAQSTSPPKRPALRRSATQASSESPSKRSIEADGVHAEEAERSSPSRRPQLRRSATQGDSSSPSRRANLTWGTAPAGPPDVRFGEDPSPNLKEHMAQFMPW
ncbi:unnamed protein product, partial [Symbiodinium pilosum]